MPQLELKSVQRELEQGSIWPLYWVYGPEKFKAREIFKRIRAAVLGQDSEATKQSLFSWNEESFEGAEVEAETVLDSARSFSLSGGVKLIVVREAHALKSVELLAELFGQPKKCSDLTFVCVCLAKDLDGRKKFSKQILDQAAVVHCEEVPEGQRESWVQYLAKRRDIQLSSTLVMKLMALDPWSLDIVDQELEKYSIADLEADVVLQQASTLTSLGGGDAFLESFFSRSLKAALGQVSVFANHTEEALPLLGLLGWNVRQMVLLISDREKGTRFAKVSPYLMDRFRRWMNHWNLNEVIELQKELSQLDFYLKQTPLLPLGLWTQLVTRFCR